MLRIDDLHVQISVFSADELLAQGWKLHRVCDTPGQVSMFRDVVQALRMLGFELAFTNRPLKWAENGHLFVFSRSIMGHNSS